jgi:Predicted pyridoxal phosphate-dependent enzyme apparently involved in regulation of cell wall biogenesis
LENKWKINQFIYPYHNKVVLNKNISKKALETNWITSGGPNVNDFENVLENYLSENSFVTALNSGTSAIHLALILLGSKIA